MYMYVCIHVCHVYNIHTKAQDHFPGHNNYYNQPGMLHSACVCPASLIVTMFMRFSRLSVCLCTRPVLITRVIVVVMRHLNIVCYEGQNFYSDKNVFYVCNSIPMVLICDTKKPNFINLLDGCNVHLIVHECTNYESHVPIMSQ